MVIISGEIISFIRKEFEVGRWVINQNQHLEPLSGVIFLMLVISLDTVPRMCVHEPSPKNISKQKGTVQNVGFSHMPPPSPRFYFSNTGEVKTEPINSPQPEQNVPQWGEKKNAMSFIWTHFHFSEDDIKQKEVKWKNCGETLSASEGNATNLLNHQYHITEYELCIFQKGNTPTSARRLLPNN